ncbi:hypothetical protein [Devosia sp.]|uniref:hypothetical protein n=1 Tax=Devosia sp. TaxID=1871048 RepID=UPI003A8DBD47
MIAIRALATASLLGVLLVPVAMAQDAPMTQGEGADMTEFADACLDARAFFLPDLDPALDPAPFLSPLCVCLTESLSVFPQVDIDILAADLAGTATDEMHAAHPDYPELQERVAPALNFCFGTAEVQAGMSMVTDQITAE